MGIVSPFLKATDPAGMISFMRSYLLEQCEGITPDVMFLQRLVLGDVCQQVHRCILHPSACSNNWKLENLCVRRYLLFHPYIANNFWGVAASY